MPNRTLAFAYAVCTAFAALIAFLFCVSAERTVHVLEDSRMVWINENDGTHDTGEVARTVQEVADEYGAAIGYTVLDVDEPGSKVRMYLAVSDADSRHGRWLSEGYPSFGRGFTVQTHPIDAFGDVGPNGHYVLLGAAPEAEAALRGALADHGLYEAPGSQPTELWHFFAGGSLLHLLVVSVLAAATATGAGVLLRAREYAVQRLQGRSCTSILGRDLAQVGRLYAVVLPVTTGAVLAFLGLYNLWAQLHLYALFTGLFLALLLAACLVTHAVVLGAVHTTAILPALKGRLPVSGANTVIHLVRVPVLVLTLLIVGGVALTLQTVREQRTGLELHAEHGDTVRPALSSNYGWADPDTVDGDLGPWLREADSEGDLVLALRADPDQFLPREQQREEQVPVLLVNDAYLDQQEVLAPDGERHGAGETVRVLLPESASGQADLFAAGVGDRLGGTSTAEHLDVEVRPAADGQTLFTYGTQGELQGGALPVLHEPVVIALPNGEVFSDSDYVTHMSQGATLFPDPGVVEQARAEDPQVSRYVSMVEAIETGARQEYAVTSTQLRTEVFNLAGAGAVLLLTTVAACVVHVRTRAQAVLVRHISGWRFLSAHRRLLTVEAAVAVVFVGAAALYTAAALAGANDPAAPPLGPQPTAGSEPVHAAAIATAALALTLAVLARFHRTLVREGVSQA